jgi:hypothetical protein
MASCRTKASPLHYRDVRQRLRVLFTFILFLFLTPLASQDQTPLFRSASELVLVDVQVLRVKTGAPAAGLMAKDLRVFEEGVPQDIACSGFLYGLATGAKANFRGTSFRCR